MPSSAAAATSGPRSDGRAAGGGSVSVAAGTLVARTNRSKPPGSETSRNRASSEVTTNVCGIPRGPYTNAPEPASITSPPTQKVGEPSTT